MGTAGDDFEGAYFFGGSVGFFFHKLPVDRQKPKATLARSTGRGGRGGREGGLCIVVWAPSLSNFQLIKKSKIF